MAKSEDQAPSGLFDRLKTVLVEERDKRVAQGGELATRFVSEAIKFASRTSTSPEAVKAFQQAGSMIKDLRHVAGMTRQELAEAMDLEDKDLIKAVEEGTATLSFELILRLSAVLARHDPLPLVMNLLRTYLPDLWGSLENWGPGRIPVQYERERLLVNIYRQRDEARKLTDEQFRKVLAFVDAAFEMSMAFLKDVEAEQDEDPSATESKD